MRDGGWIVFGQIAAIIGALVRVLTEHLDPKQYGQLSLSLTVIGLVSGVVLVGVIPAISRFYPIAVEKQNLPGYLVASRELMIYATAAVIAVGIMLVVGLLWTGCSQ